MINLDDEDTIFAINDILGRESRRGLRKLIKYEIKPEKFENRILCLCDYRFFIISVSKNNKPGKIEHYFHFLDIKKLESLNNNQLLIQTNDNKEYKIYSFESSNSLSDSSDLENNSSILNVDEILSYYSSNLFDVFPSVTIKEIIEIVNIQPEKRLQTIYNEIFDVKVLKKKLNLCDSYAKAYRIYSDLYSVNFYQEVEWDSNVIYGKNSLNEFSLNDFDYVNLKDFYPLISALKHNKWFEGFHSEGIKLTNEMQEELIKILILPSCNIKRLSLIQSNIKFDFLNKLLNSLTTIKANKQQQNLSISNTFTNLESINLSRNSIEDRGLIIFTNLFKDHITSSTHSNLLNISLCKCSISSKSINNLFSTINLYLLKNLDLSFNNLKEEPQDFLKFLSEPNELVELNLSNTDIDIDKLFMSLGKGGCDTSLKKLILNNNTTFAKFSTNENLIKFLLNAKSLVHLELSGCKLSTSVAQIILSTIKFNQNMIANGLNLNLSMNDLGSHVRQFMQDLNNNNAIVSLDLSDNNLDTDCDLLIDNMHSTNIKSLSLSRNFQNSKSKHLARMIQSLIKWLTLRSNTLECLWLIDCKLKTPLNDLISELGECTKLRLLDISGNDIGDFGVNLLSKSLQVNRSLETLIFDRSNVSITAYQHIIDSLKRNYTLKTIQMPINDICILYQKSPDKVVDIVKQMTESLAQRNLLNAQQKCDLNQLFKTKMKLINDFNQSSSIGQQLNVSLGSASSNASSSSLLSPSKIKSNNNHTETEIDSDSNNETNNYTNPSSIKEILQNLNESANSYLNTNSIDKQYSKLVNQDLYDKLDDFVLNLEKDLLNKLKKTYPKYSNQIQQNLQLFNANTTTNSSQTNINYNSINSKENPCGSDLIKLRACIKEYMNSMLIQMHNDICEMTYKLSLSMAEKLMSEVQTSIPKSTSGSISTQNKSSSQTNTSLNENRNHDTLTSIENLGKKIVGGIKLPFANLGLTNASPSNINDNNKLTNDSTNHATTNSVQHRIELMNNNSKSKRPISSQMYDLSPTNTNRSVVNELVGSTMPNRSISPGKQLSSSSNENLIENSSEDELENDRNRTTEKVSSVCSSREKTPDSYREEDLQTNAKPSAKSTAPPPPPKNDTSTKPLIIDQNKQKKETNDQFSSVPVPAPRKNKTNIVKSFFGGINSHILSSKSTAPTSPKPFRKQITTEETHTNTNNNKEQMTISTDSKSIESNTTNDDLNELEAKPLQHFNKDRPRRSNVKRPTIKNPQAKIEVETPNEDLNIINTPKPKPLADINENEVESKKQDEPPKQSSSPPASIPVKTTQVEMPKISMNVLENVKLRKTIIKPKIEENTTQIQSTSTPTTASTSSNQTTTPNTSVTPSTTTTTATTTSSQPNKLGTRFSMFENPNQGIGFLNSKILKKQSDSEIAEALEENKETESTSKPSTVPPKPLPPVPPVKPPRPTYTPALPTNSTSGLKGTSTNDNDHPTLNNQSSIEEECVKL